MIVYVARCKPKDFLNDIMNCAGSVSLWSQICTLKYEMSYMFNKKMSY